MKTITAVAVVAVACAGCSTLKHESIQTSDGGMKKIVGTVTTWSPDKAAAVVVDGKVCMQLPTRIVSLGTKGVGGGGADIGGSPVVNGGRAVKAAGAAGGDFRSDASSTVVATERTTFLAFSLFYLCQMAMNESIKEPQVERMMQYLIAESAKVVPAAESLTP